MNKRVLAASVALLVLLQSAPALAETVSITYKGNILGFGYPWGYGFEGNYSLSRGEAISVTFNYSTTAHQYLSVSSNQAFAEGGSMNNDASGQFATVSVGSNVFTYTGDLLWQYQLDTPAADPALNKYIMGNSSEDGPNWDNVNATIQSSNPFFSSLNLSQSLDYVLQAGDAGAINIEKDYDGTGIIQASISEVIVSVPEPASWALMLSGFGLSGAALRSRRRRVRLGPVIPGT